jgi:DNA-binding NarL/FixJ family response regulator
MAAQILIVDDSPVLRQTLRFCLERNAAWEVCGEAENGQVAVDKVQELNPDVVILDFAMPVMNGLDAAKKIAAIAPETITLLFTMQESRALVTAAREAGIREIFSKSEGLGALLTGLKMLLGEHNPKLA